MKLVQNFCTKAIFLCLALFAIAGTASSEQLLNFKVEQEAVYEVTHEQLLEFGLDIGGEALTNIALTNNGIPVPLELTGSTANQTQFGVGAKLRFIGRAVETLYSKSNIYTLTLSSTAQRLIDAEAINIPARAAYAASYLAHKEYAPQAEYTFASPDPDEPWYAKRLLALRKPSVESVPVTLDDYLPGGNSGSTGAKLRVQMWGGSNFFGSRKDHHVRVNLNGQVLIDETFDGISKQDLNASVPNIRNGVNYVGLELPLDQGYDYDVVNLDSITISYPRAFVAIDDSLTFESTFRKFLIRGFSSNDIGVYRQSPSGNVTRLESAEVEGRCNVDKPRCRVRFGGIGKLSKYFVVSQKSVLTPQFDLLPVGKDIKSGNAEYLIITHPDFLAEPGEPDYFQQLSQALTGRFSSVDVVDVQQIYAQFGYHQFDPQAIRDYIKYAAEKRGTTTVLLVGGDTYDYHGYQNHEAQSFIPSIYVATGELMNFAPVDAKYVDTDDDDVPDLSIGRLPVRTRHELSVLLSKRAAYINRNYSRKAVFAADKFDDLQQYSFKLDAQLIQQSHFDSWEVSNAFLDDMTSGAARTEIINAINQGVSLTSFFGHSSTAQWSFSGMFNGSDATNLDNAGRPTVVTQWGCWNTYYANPNEDSMGHQFMMSGEQGAVSVLGATTLTSADNEKRLAKLFFKYIAMGKSLGQAMTLAKQEFAQTDAQALDVILGWTLLGFPELML